MPINEKLNQTKIIYMYTFVDDMDRMEFFS